MASTYVNDLRLNELATGDASGSWGTITNTNLELIAEAFSFGTEAIPTNVTNSTHTTTIADGATDPGRSMFLTYTGSQNANVTVTLAPNTVSKMWFIENATTGSSVNLIIKQGSGATVTIPHGQTKAIYSDGAGSGAKIVDAFASLSVVDLKVQDDLTVTDDVAIGGLATVGGTLGVTGIATFTDDIIIGDGKTIGSASTVGAITIASDGDIALTGVVTANAGVVVDEMTLDGDTLTATDTFTIDAVDDITLNSDNSGRILFGDASILYGIVLNSSSNFVLEVGTNDKDMLFKGQDNGESITALTLDMSDAGSANFNHDAIFGDNGKAIFGASSDLVIYHDGSNSYVQDGGTGQLRIDTNGTDVRITKTDSEFMGKFITDGGVELYHNNIKTFETTAAGVQVTGLINIASLGGANPFITASGHNVFQTDVNTTYFYGGGLGFQFRTADNSAINISVSDTCATVFNEQGNNADFRIESDGNANMFLIDASANTIGIGTTQMNTVGNNAVGINLLADGMVGISRVGVPLKINRTVEGGIIEFYEAGTVRGQIDISGDRILIRSSGDAAGMRFDSASCVPLKNGSVGDGTIDLGASNARFNDIFATNGTIQTSDQNEKQDIATLTSAEMLVAKRISALFKTFRWKDRVVSKGDNARTHSGIIAQDVQAAFAAESLDAGDYSMFISTTWTNDDGDEQTRMGIRYPELLSFLAAYNEQRFAAIETRLTALEG